MMETTDYGDGAAGPLRASKSFIAHQIEQRTTQVGARMGTAADDLRGVGDRMRANDAIGPAATYVDHGADAIDRLARYLQDANMSRMADDLERFARRQPWAVTAGALVAGFAAARFLKAARRARDDGDRYAI